ncbi:Similar to Rrad: GTP-binding protein RAD (Mus musculus) [Cotesia congregata]|uniref:Similar to Rrad: GTP-binding protein RAD (Mus musculus) n=1 Tax=Cotesia congregata TaxID=51543 RepID=A0A8J2HC68_COTCN|nr:Similar to Rrad: GTP-binding protein RAD (Mus musculus) [Cotesia congregata]
MTRPCLVQYWATKLGAPILGHDWAQLGKENQPEAYIVMYSVIDKVSFQQAEELLSKLHDQNVMRARPAILVGNKIDLVRSRVINFQGML